MCSSDLAIIGVLSQSLVPKKAGRVVAAYEMLVVTPAIANLIRENKTYRIPSSIQTGKKYGMQLMDDALFNLWKNGICEEKECLVRAVNPGELRMKITKAKQGIFDEEEDEEEE